MSKMRCISASVFVRSANSESPQEITCRVGASRLPSFIIVLAIVEKKGRGSSRSGARPKDERVFGSERIESLLEASGMRPLGFGKGLEPLGNLLEPLFARCAGHPWIHVGVFVGFARNRGDEIGRGAADRFPGDRIRNLLEVFELAMSIAGLTF